MAGFHQAVAQGAPGVGLAGVGQPEGQHVDAALDEAALGQVVQLLPERQRHPVVLEGLLGALPHLNRYPTKVVTSNKMLPKSTVAHRLRFMATLWPLPIHSRATTSRRNQATIPTGRR